MDLYDIKRYRLYRQHITDPADKHTVCRDLNGLQAQFTVNVYYGLKIRCSEEITPLNFGNGLVKNWTIRGTVHAFNEDELSLYKHEDSPLSPYRGENYRGCGLFGDAAYEFAKNKEAYSKETDEYRKNGYAWTLIPERQQYFSRFIVEKVAEGVCTRDALKRACFEYGMTKPEADSMFDQWGGGMRELCERGFLCYRVCEKKEYMLAPRYKPMDRESAETEIAERYFRHFAPATIKDFAYYFGYTQRSAKELMSRLPLKSLRADGTDYFYLGELPEDVPDLPQCVLLSGFDQLMLGYKKEESLFLPKEYVRGIFNLAGIVMPPILLRGTVVGRWRKKNKRITFELFQTISEKDKTIIENTAVRLYDEINKIEWTML